MKIRLCPLLLACCITVAYGHQSDDDEVTVSKIDKSKFSTSKERRFLIYDVNHGEGFNLRRDVYMRIANAVRLLREAGENFVLVLPPWGGLYHWDKQETKLKWANFFDVESLNRFVPLIEFDDFLKEHPSPIENVVYLQHYAEGWGTEYVHKFDGRPCNGHIGEYKMDKNAQWKGWFFGYKDVRALNFECISFQGDSATLRDLVLKKFAEKNAIFFDRGETVLHAGYGEEFYWDARRSMRYSKELVQIGNNFRQKELSSTDSSDKTSLASDWTTDTPRRDASGGDFVCAHWRRRDFVRAHRHEVPDLDETAKQLTVLAASHNTHTLFLATDAPDHEVDDLSKKLKLRVVQYKNITLSDGAVAIVDQVGKVNRFNTHFDTYEYPQQMQDDQEEVMSYYMTHMPCNIVTESENKWICAHARAFIGTHVSTFSYRIQEDREILGFPVETTFSRLCPKANEKCEQPAKWTIVY